MPSSIGSARLTTTRLPSDPPVHHPPARASIFLIEALVFFDHHTLDFRDYAHRIRMSSSLGADQRITRNAAGEVVGLRHARQGHEQDFEVHITRDLRGLELERSLPGGVRSRWLRDRFGRPEQQQLLVGNLLQRERAYRWEIGDRLRMIFDSQYGTVRYGHDPVGSLALAQYDSDGARELRMPDAVGNLFRTEDRSDREYGPAGQLLKSIDAKGNTHRYSYDAEGNLVSKVRNDQEYWLYCWAIDGTLKKVVRPDGSEVTFSYDPLGRRISKTYRGQTTRWVWDGNVPLHEWVEGELQQASPPIHPNISNDSQAIRREAELSALLTRGPPERGTRQKPITWLFEPESFAPLAKLTGEDQYSITCDHLGTPIAMHNAEGAEVWSAQLGTWGDLRNQTKGNAQDCPFRWPGQYEDVETGLYYNRFRYYDPEAGQYVTQDPLGLHGGFVPYGYVRDSTTWIDPFGLVAGVGDPRAGVESHLARFESGSSVFVPEFTLNRGVPMYGQLGRNDGLFVTTPTAADRLERAASGDRDVLKQRLGIPPQYWNEPIYRSTLLPNDRKD